MLLLIWFLEDVYARAPLFVCVLVTDPWWIIYQKSVLWSHLVQFCVIASYFEKTGTGNTSKICTVICGSTRLCVLYNPLIWAEEGKIREQNMNGGMHEKHVKDTHLFFCVVFYSTDYLTPPVRTPPQGAVGHGIVWIGLRHAWPFTHNPQFFVEKSREKRDGGPGLPRRFFTGRWDNLAFKPRIKTTLKRRWMNRWISRWQLSSQRCITLKLLRRLLNLLTFIIIQVRGVDTHSATSRRRLN